MLYILRSWLIVPHYKPKRLNIDARAINDVVVSHVQLFQSPSEISDVAAPSPCRRALNGMRTAIPHPLGAICPLVEGLLE